VIIEGLFDIKAIMNSCHYDVNPFHYFVEKKRKKVIKVFIHYNIIKIKKLIL